MTQEYRMAKLSIERFHSVLWELNDKGRGSLACNAGGLWACDCLSPSSQVKPPSWIRKTWRAGIFSARSPKIRLFCRLMAAMLVSLTK